MICGPGKILPFEYQTNPVIRWLLYSDVPVTHLFVIKFPFVALARPFNFESHGIYIIYYLRKKFIIQIYLREHSILCAGRRQTEEVGESYLRQISGMLLHLVVMCSSCGVLTSTRRGSRRKYRNKIQNLMSHATVKQRLFLQVIW